MTFEPQWKYTEGANHVRCMLCEDFKAEVWLWFTTPSKWHHCVCVECARKV